MRTYRHECSSRAPVAVGNRDARAQIDTGDVRVARRTGTVVGRGIHLAAGGTARLPTAAPIAERPTTDAAAMPARSGDSSASSSRRSPSTTPTSSTSMP